MIYRYPPTNEMISYIQGKLGVEEAARRIESIRVADGVRIAMAIGIVYRSLKSD